MISNLVVLLLLIYIGSTLVFSEPVQLEDYYKSCVLFPPCRSNFIFYDHSINDLIKGRSYERSFKDFSKAISFLEHRHRISLDYLMNNQSDRLLETPVVLAYELASKFPKDYLCNNDQRLVFDLKNQRMNCQCQEGYLCSSGSDTTLYWLVIVSLWLATIVGVLVLLCLCVKFIIERHEWKKSNSRGLVSNEDFAKIVVAMENPISIGDKSLLKHQRRIYTKNSE